MSIRDLHLVAGGDGRRAGSTVSPSGSSIPFLNLQAENASATSADFVVPDDVQSVQFDYFAWSLSDANGGAQVQVSILSGTPDVVLTQLDSVTGSHNQGWKHAVMDISALRGQTIKLRLQVTGIMANDRALVTNLTFSQDIPDWTPSNIRYVRTVTDTTSIDGPYALLDNINTKLTSAAFTVPITASDLGLKYLVWDTTNLQVQRGVGVSLLSGPDFSIVTNLGNRLSSWNNGWQTTTFPVSNFRGHTVKVRVTSDTTFTGARARIDTLTLTGNVDAPPLGGDYHRDSYLQLDGPNVWAMPDWSSRIYTGTDKLSFDYSTWTTGDANANQSLFVDVFSGATFATQTTVATLQSSALAGWHEHVTVSLAAFRGQIIKLRFRASGKARLDNVLLSDGQFAALGTVQSSSSACTLYPVQAGSPVTIITPAEPYIVQLYQRAGNGGALLKFTVGGSRWYFYALGQTIGGLALPRATSATFEIIHDTNTLYAEVCNLRQWEPLISYRPNAQLQQQLHDRAFYTEALGPVQGIGWPHKIERAFGNINVDYYAVRIAGDKLPFKPLDATNPDGERSTTARFTAAELLEYVRTHINYFALPNGTEFRPYSARYGDGDDAAVWSSTNPDGSVISIRLAAIEDGSVWTSDYAYQPNQDEAHWIFSTVFTIKDGDHPVSGNRQFGIKRDGSDIIFYIQGADRTTTRRHNLAAETVVFPGADALWKSLDDEIVKFVNTDTNPNAAERVAQESARYNWQAVCQTYFTPTVRWIDERTITRTCQ